MVDKPGLAVVEHDFIGTNNLVDALKVRISELRAQERLERKRVVDPGDVLAALALEVSDQLVLADGLLYGLKCYLKVINLLGDLDHLQRNVAVDHQLLDVQVVKHAFLDFDVWVIGGLVLIDFQFFYFYLLS